MSRPTFFSATPATASYQGTSKVTSGGYNRFRYTCSLDRSTLTPDQADTQNDTHMELGALENNGGPTPNYLPASTSTNSVLDKIPASVCEALMGESPPLDQRGRTRPAIGFEGDEALGIPSNPQWCDPGAVERGKEILPVCGPPLDMSDRGPSSRCRYLTVESAMKVAADGDIIVVSGVVTENVTLDKDVTLRGPLANSATAGTHMGFLQGAPAPATCTTGSSVVTVAGGTRGDDRGPEHPLRLRDLWRRHQQRGHADPSAQHRL